MVDPDRVRVWAARLAAPVAFFFFATVLVVLVQRGFEDDADTAPGPATGAVETGTTETGGRGDETTTGSGNPGRRFYRVRDGDTLETIAARFEIEVDELLELNPGIDPLALTPGQRIRVRPRA
ncbi:MAG TPA: LysM domain-containing protein [Gaiellaceae bacterium]|nr:LysM domain-containing protein [Gaiellaceae bacterium]